MCKNKNVKNISSVSKCFNTKEVIWPPLEPKTKSCFSTISSDWFIRRITQMLKYAIHKMFNVAQALGDRFFKNKLSHISKNKKKTINM